MMHRHTRRSLSFGAVGAILGLVAACSGTPGPAPTPTPTSSPRVALAAAPSLAALLSASCAATESAAAPMRPSSRGGSSVAVASNHVIAADFEGRALDVLDAQTGARKISTPVVGRPRQLVALSDGRVAVTTEDPPAIELLALASDGALTPLCARGIPELPWGIAASPDERELVLTTTWPARAVVLDSASLERRAVVPLARAPRGVIVDEKRVVVVTHLVGSRLSRFSLDDTDTVVYPTEIATTAASPFAGTRNVEVVRTATQGYALASVELPLATREEVPLVRGGAPSKAAPTRGAPGAPALPTVETRILAPMVSVDPGSDRPDRRSNYYQAPGDGLPKETPVVSAIDASTGGRLTDRLLATWPIGPSRECLLPRAIAVDEVSDTAWVACDGIDEVLALDAGATEPSRAQLLRAAVPEGPTGVAIDAVRGRVIVFSEAARAVTALSLEEGTRQWSTQLAELDLESPVSLGRKIFTRTDNPRVARDSVACASCHPDGLDDGLTWTTPEGPRQTPMLAGRLRGTAPYGWARDKPTLAGYIESTVERLGGTGLSPHELEGLVAYLESLDAARPSASREGVAERGRAIFFGQGACAGCHAGGEGTDAKMHALDPPRPDGRDSAFDTPSLRFVSQTAPYFHDGRYKNLRALVNDSRSGMGLVELLSAADRDALIVYLETL